MRDKEEGVAGGPESQVRFSSRGMPPNPFIAGSGLQSTRVQADNKRREKC